MAQSQAARETCAREKDGHKWPRLLGGIMYWAGTLATMRVGASDGRRGAQPARGKAIGVRVVIGGQGEPGCANAHRPGSPRLLFCGLCIEPLIPE